ncbi:HAMP domain-containing sensor histidine kinase [Bdellovibrionota bacterium FG-2]
MLVGQKIHLRGMDRQVEVMTRRHILSGDFNVAKEAMTALKPTFIESFQIVDASRSKDLTCARGMRAVPMYFDSDRIIPKASVCYTPDRKVFFEVLFLVNVLIVLAAGSMILLQRRYLKLVQNSQRDFFSRFLGMMEHYIRSDFSKGSEPQLELSKDSGEFEKKVKNLIQLYITQKSKMDLQVSLSNLASQVAHDIRSPLTSLNVVIEKVQAHGVLDEQSRTMVRTAVGRIRDIANNLLSQNRSLSVGATDLEPLPSTPDLTTKPTSPTSNETASPTLLCTLIDLIASEKRAQFSKQIEDGKLEILTDLSSGYGLFAKIQPTEFSRLLSNLINNAVEAMSGVGRVQITLKPSPISEAKIELEISDNGKGIPPELIPLLGTKGNTFGKNGGSGLGLYHAKTSVESWDGEFLIESSQEARFTRTKLRLPKLDSTEIPKWFPELLLINAQMTIVVLDDDPTIHDVWNERFRDLLTANHKIDLLHFHSPEEILAWYRKTLGPEGDALYLCDYEMRGSKHSGIDVIQMLDIAKKSILVTSHTSTATHGDAPLISERCEKLGIRFLPKALAALIPIKVALPSS